MGSVIIRAAPGAPAFYASNSAWVSGSPYRPVRDYLDCVRFSDFRAPAVAHELPRITSGTEEGRAAVDMIVGLADLDDG